MPVLVHFADEREFASIKKNGLKARDGGVFGMPVLKDFYVSHQWMREMRRWRAKSFIAVYFRIPDDEMVWSGRYSEEHKHHTLGEAIKDVIQRKDPLGFEVFIERTVKPKEIVKIKKLQQNIGWRYYPESKGKRIACTCPYCIKRGHPKTRRLINRLDPPGPPQETDYRKLMDKLKNAKVRMDHINALKGMGRKRRYADPVELAYLIDAEPYQIPLALAEALAVFRHKNTGTLLRRLLAHPQKEVKKAAVESVFSRYYREPEKLLAPFMNDTVIVKEYEFQKEYFSKWSRR